MGAVRVVHLDMAAEPVGDDDRAVLPLGKARRRLYPDGEGVPDVSGDVKAARALLRGGDRRGRRHFLGNGRARRGGNDGQRRQACQCDCGNARGAECGSAQRGAARAPSYNNFKARPPCRRAGPRPIPPSAAAGTRSGRGRRAEPVLARAAGHAAAGGTARLRQAVRPAPVRRCQCLQNAAPASRTGPACLRRGRQAAPSASARFPRRPSQGV